MSHTRVLRLRYGKDQRGRFEVTARSAELLEAKVARMRRLAADMADAGVEDGDREKVLVEAAAAKNERDMAKIEAVARELCEEGPEDTAPPLARTTFRQVAETWFSGDLAARFPRVRVRTPSTIAKDRQRLRTIASAIADKPVNAITLADARAAMSLVPPVKQGTRRLYETLIYQVMKHARRLELIETSPIPSDFVSAQGDPPLFQYLRPPEELRLVTCPAIPLETRLAYALMTREGLRPGGVSIVRWSHIDLTTGLFSHNHKTRRPRRWVLGPDVLRVLVAWRERYHDSEMVLPGYTHLNMATLLRKHLLMAGVTRPALHTTTADERQLRGQDLRATFVTLNLANGRDDRWIQDRTGHADVKTMDLYRRMAREAADLNLGPMTPLDQALGAELGLKRVGQRVGQKPPRSTKPAMDATTDYSRSNTQRTLLEPKTATSSTQTIPQRRSGPAGLSGVGQTDPVQEALALALRAAVEAGRLDLVSEVTRELSARRQAASPVAGVTSLDAARRKRGEQ
jgi:integrase